MSPEQNIFEATPTTFPVNPASGEEPAEPHAAVAAPAPDLFELSGFDDEPELNVSSTLRDGTADDMQYLGQGATVPRSDGLLTLSPAGRARLRQAGIFAAFALTAFLVATVGMSLLRGSGRHLSSTVSPGSAAHSQPRTEHPDDHRSRRTRRAPRRTPRAAGRIRRSPRAIAPTTPGPLSSPSAGSIASPESSSTTPAPAAATSSPTYAPPPEPSSPAPETSPSPSSATSSSPPDPEFSFER